jgi:hypothetical protein
MITKQVSAYCSLMFATPSWKEKRKRKKEGGSGGLMMVAKHHHQTIF